MRSQLDLGFSPSSVSSSFVRPGSANDAPRPAPGDLPDLLEDLLIGSSGSGCLLQWVVPAEVRGGCYADLVEHLIDRHSALAIGLLRAGVLTASPLPYVLTNPPPDTPLQEAAPPRRGGHR